MNGLDLLSERTGKIAIAAGACKQTRAWLSRSGGKQGRNDGTRSKRQSNCLPLQNGMKECARPF